jgi:hypothetical protein
MDFISSVLALAEPVPFTVAILIVKSFVRLVVIVTFDIRALHRMPLGQDAVRLVALAFPGGRAPGPRDPARAFAACGEPMEACASAFPASEHLAKRFSRGAATGVDGSRRFALRSH